MAEHAATEPAETGASMDYAEHERTYERFVALTALGIVVTVNVLLDLLLFAFGGGAGLWLGYLTLILLIVAATIGLGMNANTKPSLAVTAIAAIFVILTVG